MFQRILDLTLLVMLSLAFLHLGIQVSLAGCPDECFNFVCKCVARPEDPDIADQCYKCTPYEGRNDWPATTSHGNLLQPELATFTEEFCSECNPRCRQGDGNFEECGDCTACGTPMIRPLFHCKLVNSSGPIGP